MMATSLQLARSLLLLIIIVQICIISRVATTTALNQVDKIQVTTTTTFYDPIVWNSESLYRAQHSAPTLVNTSKESHHQRNKRSATTNHQHPQQQYVDACQSKVEILTPYYATNSKGKVRKVVNSELLQQAVQIETCVRSISADGSKSSIAGKCNAQPDCGCEQKFKWHRLLVVDLNEGGNNGGNSRGIFTDWFLFPSNCVCRCKNSPTNSTKQLMKILTASQT